MSGLKRGTLSVHASQTIASYWLSPRLVAFRHAYPQIEVKLAVGNTAQTAKAIIDGTAELGFVEGRVDDAALQQSTIDQDRLTIVVGAGHPVGEKEDPDQDGPGRGRLGVARVRARARARNSKRRCPAKAYRRTS